MKRRRLYIYHLKCPHCLQEHILVGVTEDALHPICYRCGGYCEVAYMRKKEAEKWLKMTPMITQE